MSYITAEDLERYQLEAEGLVELIEDAIAECDDERNGNSLKLLAEKRSEIEPLLNKFEGDLFDLETAHDALGDSQNKLLLALDKLLNDVNDMPDLLARDHVLTVAAYPHERKL